jgi:acyl-CoA thioesterase
MSETFAPFSAVLGALRRDREAFYAQPPDDWRQGRTLFGGLSAALSIRAAQKEFPDLPPLRSAQFAFIGPAAGALEIEPVLVRAGKSAAFVEVTARSEGMTAVRAMLVFGAARRSSHSYRDLPAPAAAPPDLLACFFDTPFAPRFSRHFDARFAGGARAVSGANKPELLLWLRHRDGTAPDDIASLVALGDVPPPAAMTMFVTPAPISTVTWSLDVLGDRIAGGGWHLMLVEAETVGDGYATQRMTLWDTNGTAMLAARQSVAVFG